MRAILSLLILFSVSAFADEKGGWMKEGGTTAYWEKASCEAAEGAECFSAKSCPADECAVAEVDDLSEPKYLEQATVACEGKEDCQAKLEEQKCAEGASALIDRSLSKVYCAVPNGYGKKRALVLDAAKKAAKDAALAAAQSESNSKATKLSQIKANVKTCMTTLANPAATLNQVRLCSALTLKLLIAADLRSDEL